MVTGRVARSPGGEPLDRSLSGLNLARPDLVRDIAATKALAQPPLPLDMARFQQLANDIKELNERLEYRYPGESNVD